MKKVVLVQGDNRLGFKQYTPYEKYNCLNDCAAASIPQELVDKYVKRGRLIIPVDDENKDQYINIIDKDSNEKYQLEKN